MSRGFAVSELDKRAGYKSYSHSLSADAPKAGGARIEHVCGRSKVRVRHTWQTRIAQPVRRFRLETVTGIFASQADAERAARAVASSLGKDRITLLIPGRPTEPPRSLDLTATEQPGMGKAIGGVIGATLGI